MKLRTFVLVLFLLVHSSRQIPEIRKCPSDFPITDHVMDHCGILTCNRRGGYELKSCEPKKCQRGKRIGYVIPNVEKPYPACCGGEICPDDFTSP